MYFDLLENVSKQWLTVQLCHDVSQAAADDFWAIAIEWMNRLHAVKETLGVKRKIPLFPNQRKKLYAAYCPRVAMNFAFKNKQTEQIVHVRNVERAPTTYEKDPNYAKLYESAFVKVI